MAHPQVFNLDSVPNHLDVTARVLHHDFKTGASVVVDIPPGRDQFDVLAQVEKRMGVGQGTGSPVFDQIMAARARGDQKQAASGGRVDDGAVPPRESLTHVDPPAPEARGPDVAKKGADVVQASVFDAPEPQTRAAGEFTQAGPATTATRKDGPPRGGVRDTSMAAYRALQYSGKLTAQQKLVVDRFMAYPSTTYTRQELARDLQIGINAVCGRVNELLAEPMNLLVETGRKTCSVTKNNVNALALAGVQPKERT